MIRYVLAALMVAGSGLGLLGAACHESCPPQTLADIEARYSLAALAQCKGYASLAECPSAPALRAARAEQEKAASCR